ncbi:MAG: hypothetical protein IEMM0008_1073 [bacterium]|nr:MAG: hypothetical protein IEMM0008_1073 [bacterium]
MSLRNESKIKALDAYNLALKTYREKDFLKARELFETVLKAVSKDGPSILYIERCDEFIKNPPPADWDGVYTMTTK